MFLLLLFTGCDFGVGTRLGLLCFWFVCFSCSLAHLLSFQFNANTYTYTQHARRKGTAPAFSNRHVQRMNQVALERTEKWIEEKLIPWTKSGQSFDVAEEMISITLEAICKTAFEYDISEEEKYNFISNSELVFKEFLTKSINNPLRKYIGRWIPDRRKALQAAGANVLFAKKIIAKYRSNPNPLEGTIIDYLSKNPCYANDDELAADVLLYLVAGHDVSIIYGYIFVLCIMLCCVV